MQKTVLKCDQDPNEVVNGILSRAKNGPRALFRTFEGSSIIWRDVPAEGGNFYKMIKKHPLGFWGVYNSSCKPSWLFSDMGFISA